MEENRTGGVQADKLAVGIVLLVIGLLIFAGTMDLWNLPRLHDWWPLILIAIGVGTEAEALRTRQSNGGMFLLAVGAWMLVGSNGWWGLSIREAMPIGVVVIGALIALHAFVDRPHTKGEEKRNGCQ